MIQRHPLINTLFSLKGNPKACVYTEPLWGIPFNLFIPYASVYMLALGITDRQIGFIASIGMVFQILFSLLGGAITDKLGRKSSTYIFDLVAWSIPCLIWAFSSNFTWFVVAAVINSVSRITMNSWGCLLVEDCDKEQIVNIYAWIYISGLVAAFFAPLSGLFIGIYELIPTVRVLYLISFVLMTFKFYILNRYTTETKQGKIRMEETRHIKVSKLFEGYSSVFVQILKTPKTMVTLGIMLIMSIFSMVNSTFWSILIIENIKIPAKILSIFPFLRSFIMLLFFFTVVPRIRVFRFKRPMIIGFCTFIASQLILITAPTGGYLSLVVSVFLEALSFSLISPLLDSMQVILVDPKERARIISILYVIVMTLSSPFGWIAGVLSSVDRRLPFVMNMTLLLVGLILTFLASSASDSD
jgi:MFS family permease